MRVKLKPANNKYSGDRLRRMLLAILFHSIDPQTSDEYIRRQLKWATATDDEIAELMGDNR